jgi:hypothetical protein
MLISFLNFGIHAVMTALIVVTTRGTEDRTHRGHAHGRVRGR